MIIARRKDQGTAPETKLSELEAETSKERRKEGTQFEENVILIRI